MDIQLWMVVFLSIFMLHNLEEIITVEKWMQRRYPRIQHKIPSPIQKELHQRKDITSAQFALVVFVLSIVISVLLVVALITEHHYLFLGVNLAFALNIFTHPLQSLFLRCYTPGVFTSLCLIIPYYSFYFYHFYNTDMLATHSFTGAIAVMVFLVPVFLLSHKVGEKWS